MSYMGRERAKSVRADEVCKLARVSPYESMTGPIKQPAHCTRNPAHQSIEMVSGNGDIVGSSDNERWRCSGQQTDIGMHLRLQYLDVERAT
jgi:hypothetical protein